MKHQLILSFLFVLHFATILARSQIHVVYLGGHHGEKSLKEIEDTHYSYLLSVKASEKEARQSLIHSYKNVINGFSAILTTEEANKLSDMDGVVSIFESHPKRYSLQTTRSWDFMRLLEGKMESGINYQKDLLQKADYGKDVIVGILDTGVWPESQSFGDEGMEAIPERWKGVCQTGVSFNTSHCNRKLIGARYYLKGYEAYYGALNETEDYKSPRDKNGHGTHTASTVGGRRVPNAYTIGGFANGTASGGAPLVRLAIYKVCWPIPGNQNVKDDTCFDSDILAAFDDAVADGVDVINLSISLHELHTYTNDAIAIGSFHAVKRNIVVACSAGNDGPVSSSVRNVAPWVITVGASSTDRALPAPVVLGNNMKIEGETVTAYALEQQHPLVYAGDVERPGTTAYNTTGQCLMNTLSEELVKGKIVLCFSGYVYNVEKGLEVKRAGGIGVILQNFVDGGVSISVDAHLLPATEVKSNEPNIILDYIWNNINPTATIIPASTVLDIKPAPFMAGFSSRGPNGLESNILKPDITAPGLNILAAWSEGSSATGLVGDDRVVKYKIESGTSMSSPHVAGAAALLKAIHPDWSSAAIRSALMTTAGTTDNMGNPITNTYGNPADPFDYGSGHLQFTRAANPGLIYNANFIDYLLFLCNTFNNSIINKLEPNFLCPQSYPSPSNLNYPSIAISGLKGTITIRRIVTNVGNSDSKSVYNLTVSAPQGYSVEIFPNVLNFTFYGEKKSFDIVIKANNGCGRGDFSFGWFMWNDGVHRVRSPIVVSSDC